MRPSSISPHTTAAARKSCSVCSSPANRRKNDPVAISAEAPAHPATHPRSEGGSAPAASQVTRRITSTVATSATRPKMSGTHTASGVLASGASRNGQTMLDDGAASSPAFTP